MFFPLLVVFCVFREPVQLPTSIGRDHMTNYELLRIITFVERIRAPFEENVKAANPDPIWNIVLFLMKSHLRGDVVTMSSLASSSHIPFPSAMRKIHNLIVNGDIDQYPRTATGKATVLAPSAKLKLSFTSYAKKVKAVLSDTWGLGTGSANPEDYYFGAAHLVDQTIPPLKLIENRHAPREDLRFLLHDDNYFTSMRNLLSDFRSKLSPRQNFHLLALSDLREALLTHSSTTLAKYDIVAINIPWLGEAVSRQIIRPLDSFLKSQEVNPFDFNPAVWSTGSWGPEQFGIPIYSTFEALAVRKDLFEEQQLGMPTSFEKVIDAASQLHQPKRGVNGIVWNAAKGAPIAQSFMFFMGCCGTSVINVPTSTCTIDYNKLSKEMYRPRVLSEQGLQVLDYMRNLLKFSPPDILELDGDNALEYFMSGSSSMLYCWTTTASRLEYDVRSKVKRKVEYLPHPHGSGGSSVSPIGGFLLGIPANLPHDRAQLAFEAISWMASPAAMKEHVKNGIPIAPCFSVKADPEAAVMTPIVRMVDRLVRQNRLPTWQRPPIREYSDIERVLGEHIFAALKGGLSDRQALETCQNDIDRIMRDAGRY
jgi:multiple sugar transport system substrate-binding protein